MTARYGVRYILLLSAFVLGFGLVGCTDETVIFRDRPLFDDPPQGAAEFIGYTDQEDKLVVCGNCHVGIQAGWETTGHADAWEGLQASGHAQEFCEGCHTVNELGNTSEDEGGWVATGDPRYHDVQCESCHGPGSMHLDNPDGVRPFANLAVSGLDDQTGCAECHQGTHHPFVEQWSASAHGNVTAFAAGRAGCADCHEGKRALVAQFNETTDYAEKGDGGVMDITCGVCHDPHGSDYRANLRAPIEVASMDHLCVTCHSREGTPNPTSPNFRGPHGFQGLLVLGEDIGWIPPGSDLTDVGRIVSTHGSEANPALCATCHVSQFDITDSETGEFQLTSVGHTFEAIPCIDPETGGIREDCTLAERNFEACATSGCHGSPDVARGLFVTVRSRINNLLDELWTDSDGDAVLETSDGGLLPRVLAQEGTAQLNPSDATFTTAEGALWNAQVAWTDQRPHWGDGEIEGLADGFGSRKGSGEGVHNPFLLEALLTASIDAVQDEYGLSASVGLDLSIQAEPPPGVSLNN